MQVSLRGVLVVLLASNAAAAPFNPLNFVWPERSFWSKSVVRIESLASDPEWHVDSRPAAKGAGCHQKFRSAPEINRQHDFCEVLDSGRDLVAFGCTGCVLSVNKRNGKVAQRGHDCAGYLKPAVLSTTDDECTKVASPQGGYVLVCPGCTKIVDKDGKELVRTGDRCDEYDDEKESYLGESDRIGQTPIAWVG